MYNHKNIRKNIMTLVQLFPHLKDNYNGLVSAYWVIFDNADKVEDIQRATPAESITRNFRKLVELKMIEVPARTKASRNEKARDFKHEFATLA